MTPDMITDLMREAVYLIVLMVSVIILPSLAVGLVVSIFQAATQINEQTLSFIPKLLALALTMVVAGPWMLKVLLSYTHELFESIPNLIN